MRGHIPASAESGRLDRCEHIGVAARMVYRRCVEFEPHSIPKIADAQVTDLVPLAPQATAYRRLS